MISIVTVSIQPVTGIQFSIQTYSSDGCVIHIKLLPFSVIVGQADDDTYVIVENLRYFLSGENTSEPIFFGHHFKTIVKQGYYSGGGGYVLSKEALKRFGEKGQTYL